MRNDLFGDELSYHLAKVLVIGLVNPAPHRVFPLSSAL
jgi:hypothetical protein